MTTFPGRGAWTSVGKDNGASDYIFIQGKPDDGSTPSKGLNYEAVNLGVRAIQKRLNFFSTVPALVVDGDLGYNTSKAIKFFQSQNGLIVDGDCGPNTSKALWKRLISNLEMTYGVMYHNLFGIALHESLLDAGAVGASTPGDRGLVQWNTENSGLTIQEAHDPEYSLTKAAQRIRAAQTKYFGKGMELQINCSIAQWNAPLWADQWFTNGTPPNDTISKYVADVLAAAKTF